MERLSSDDERIVVDDGQFQPGMWSELNAGPTPFLNAEDMHAPRRRAHESHKSAWRRLFTGPFAKGHMRDIGLLVIAVWLGMGVVLFFAMQLIGYAYQELLAPELISGYTERYVGCWVSTLFAFSLSFVRMLLIWFRYRCCK